MSTISFILVVLVALVVGMASVLDERQFYRPLVACTLMGLVMGDLTTGVILGGALELIALGWMNVGAAMVPDAALASTVASVVVRSSQATKTSTQASPLPCPLPPPAKCSPSLCAPLPCSSSTKLTDSRQTPTSEALK